MKLLAKYKRCTFTGAHFRTLWIINILQGSKSASVLSFCAFTYLKFVITSNTWRLKQWADLYSTNGASTPSRKIILKGSLCSWFSRRYKGALILLNLKVFVTFGTSTQSLRVYQRPIDEWSSNTASFPVLTLRKLCQNTSRLFLLKTPS